jgi:Flp pilus assembly protein TadG
MRRHLRDDRGSAMVEFALVAPLLIGLALVVVQVALVLHVRTTLTAAAAEGSRAAAMAGSSVHMGEQRTRAVLSGNVAESVIESVEVGTMVDAGVAYSQVTIHARLPLLGLLGPTAMSIRGRSIQEHL